MTYGGDGGAKDAVIYDNIVWMLKFPKTTRDLINPQISYTTSPLSEYLGSQVYASLGLPVHETLLGTRRGKLVVACRDFTMGVVDGSDAPLPWPVKRLIHFRNLKNSFMAEDIESYSGTGSETLLSEVLATIDGQEDLIKIPGVRERFWDMFIVDAFIGNNDRNNDNWGVLLDPAENEAVLAPVYDNGGAFFNKKSFASMEKRLADAQAMREDAYLSPLCAFKYTNVDNTGHKINPFIFIRQKDNNDCTAATERFLHRVNMEHIQKIIEDVPETYGALSVMPKVQKEFYIELLRLRLEFMTQAI